MKHVCIRYIMTNGLIQFSSSVLYKMANSPQGTWGEFCWWREMQHWQHEQALVPGAHLSWPPHRSWWWAPLLYVHTSGQVRLLPPWLDLQSAASIGVASVEACHTSTCPPRTSACSQTPVRKTQRESSTASSSTCFVFSSNWNTNTHSISGQHLGSILVLDLNNSRRLDPGFSIHLNRHSFISQDGNFHCAALRQW